MKNRYIPGLKTLAVGAIIGVVGNVVTDVGGYFGDKVIKTVSHVLGRFESELDDGKGHKITYQRYQTSADLLKNILEGDLPAKKVLNVVNQVFSFAKTEEIPCSCVPLLSLLALQNLDITLIVDDSTSIGDKWNECKKLAKMVAGFGLTSENSKIHLKFLNQSGSTKITDTGMVDVFFLKNPEGGSPLIKTLEEVVSEIKKTQENSRHLLYVFTDGIPSDGAYYQPTLTWVRDAFSKDREISDNVAINFIVAGANRTTEKEYRRVEDFEPQDGQILHIDTNLSYKSEQVKCKGITLTEGLYKMKILMGAVNEDLDDLDRENSGEESQGLWFLKDAWGALRELNAELLVQGSKG